MNPRTGLALVGLALVLVALGLVFGLFGNDPLDGGNPSTDTSTYGDDQEYADPGTMSGDGSEDRRTGEFAGNQRQEVEDTEEGQSQRPMLVVRGRVVNQTGGGVPRAEVSLYLRQDLESAFRGGGFGGRGGRGGRRGRGARVEDFRSAFQMVA